MAVHGLGNLQVNGESYRVELTDNGSDVAVQRTYAVMRGDEPIGCIDVVETDAGVDTRLRPENEADRRLLEVINSEALRYGIVRIDLE